MKKSVINNNIAIPTDDKTTAVPQPCKCSFNFPAAFVASYFSSVLVGFRSFIDSIRANQFNPLLKKSFTQGVAVVAFIGNQPLRFFWNHHMIHRLLKQCHFIGARRVQVVPQRNSLAVDQYHPLRALAFLGFSDAKAPFFAGAKLPSTKLSLQSSCPCSSNSFMKIRQILTQRSCSSHAFNRRQHVDELGYSLGKSAQGAPVRKIQRIPSKTFRLSALGRPPFLPCLNFGKYCAIFSHCLSVSCHLFLVIVGLPLSMTNLHKLCHRKNLFLINFRFWNGF